LGFSVRFGAFVVAAFASKGVLHTVVAAFASKGVLHTE
jgi:hypothetical protein